MTTCGDLIDETLTHLYSGTREQINTLNGAVTAGDTTFTLSYDLKGVAPGAVLGVDLEHVYVVSVTGQTATVIRGYQGSTAAAHADGAHVTVNPKFSRYRVFQQLNHELAGLSSPGRGLFDPTTLDLTYQPAFKGYDLTGVTAIEQLLEVRIQTHGGNRDWQTVARDQIQLQRVADTDVFPSGFCLILTRGDAGRKVRVLYAAPFSDFTTEASTVASTGFPESGEDILPLGAAIRLTMPREVSRNFHETQGEPRREEGVPPGANLNAPRGLVTIYQGRVDEEAQRLQRHYPMRRYA